MCTVHWTCPSHLQEDQCAGPYDFLYSCLCFSCIFLPPGTVWLVLPCFPKHVGFVSVVSRNGREHIIGQVESWSHWIGLDWIGSLKTSWSKNPTAVGRGILFFARQGCSKPHPSITLKIYLQEWGIYNFSGQSVHHPHHKKNLLMFSLNLAFLFKICSGFRALFV